MRFSRFSFLCVWAVCLGLLVTPAALARENVRLGTVLNEPTDEPGRLISERDVRASAIVSTASERAILHLDNGQVLKLDTNSALRLEARPYDQVHVRVLSGRVVKLDRRGRPVEGGAGSWFVVGPSVEDPMALEALLLAEREVVRAERDQNLRDSNRETVSMP